MKRKVYRTKNHLSLLKHCHQSTKQYREHTLFFLCMYDIEKKKSEGLVFLLRSSKCLVLAKSEAFSPNVSVHRCVYM